MWRNWRPHTLLVGMAATEENSLAVPWNAKLRITIHISFLSLHNKEVYHLTTLEAGSLTSGCQQGCFLLWRKGLFLASLLTSGNLSCSLACMAIGLVRLPITVTKQFKGEEWFILADGFRGFSPQSLTLPILGSWWGKTSWWQEHGSDTTHLMMDRKHRERKVPGGTFKGMP
jgi:hypothetical protein